jgi:hypothetical protein
VLQRLTRISASFRALAAATWNMDCNMKGGAEAPPRGGHGSPPCNLSSTPINHKVRIDCRSWAQGQRDVDRWDLDLDRLELEVRCDPHLGGVEADVEFFGAREA